MGISVNQFQSSIYGWPMYGFPLAFAMVPLATLLLLLIIGGVEPNPGPTFPCKYCQLTFNSTSQYCDHMKVHKFIKRFTIPCCFCERQLKLTSFESHLSRFHRSVRSRPQVQAIQAVICFVCKVQLFTRKEYMNHITAHLKAGVETKCILTNCQTVFNNHRKFQKHMSRYHAISVCTDFVQPAPSISEAGFESDREYDLDTHDEDNELEDCCTQDLDGENPQDIYPEHVIKDEIARFYLKLEGELALPTSTVQLICEEIKLLSELSHYRLKISLKEQLEAANLNALLTSSIVRATFKSDPVFNVHHKNEDIEQLSSHHLRKQYWLSKFPYVDPQDHYYGTNIAGKKRRAHFVPIKETLQILLKNKKIKDMVLKSFSKHAEGKSLLEDYTDGEAYSNHKCQHHDGKCLQLIMFQDAFEFNAFGPTATLFKTIGFYYMLGNIDPEYRSKVDLNQLAALVLEKDTVPTEQEELDDKDILEEAIKPILDELEDLKVNGIDLDGEKIPVCLLYLVGDNLGQHTVGGYVRNFNCEFFCRFCSISKAEFLSNPGEVKPLRTPEEYDSSVQIAKRKWNKNRKLALLSAKRAALRKAKKQAERVISRRTAPGKRQLMTRSIPKSAYKKMCGVSFRSVKYRPSPFNSDVTGFHVSAPAMPPCLAHDIFEGILKSILPCIMDYCISTKEWFDLPTLNRRIRAFKGKGSDARDLPKPYKSLDSLSGNAVQNWNHLRLLPFIIGDLIQDPQDEVWQVYLNLKEIVEYVCAPKISLAQVAYVKHLIRSFNNSLLRLEEFFPKCLIPKVHYLCHYPDLIAIFGPLIRLFTLRFESVHKIYKAYVRNSKNYINVTKMMAQKSMLRFACSQSSDTFPADILYDPTSSCCINMLLLEPEKRAAFPTKFDTSTCEALSSIVVKGTEYKKGFYLMLKATLETTSLTVGCIDLILLDSESNVSFLLQEMVAINTFKGFFELEKPSCLSYVILPHEDIIDYYPLPSYNLSGIECISLKHSVCSDSN